MICHVQKRINLRNVKLVIGLCGGRLSGKDYVADIISKHTDIVKSSLADPIKATYSELMGVPIEDLYTQGDTKELHRLSLITLGAIKRDLHIDWWCEDLHATFAKKAVIIPDIRFKNEVDYFRNYTNRFYLFNIKADNSSLVERGWEENFADKTSTETERKLFKHHIDKTIDNSNKYEETIEERVLSLVDKYKLHNN